MSVSKAEVPRQTLVWIAAETLCLPKMTEFRMPDVTTMIFPELSPTHGI